MLVLGLEFTKCMSDLQTGKTLIRLLLPKQSDLYLHYLSKVFLQETSIQKYRTFAVPRMRLYQCMNSGASLTCFKNFK